jgi:hypothetical protein
VSVRSKVAVHSVPVQVAGLDTPPTSKVTLVTRLVSANVAVATTGSDCRKTNGNSATPVLGSNVTEP